MHATDIVGYTFNADTYCPSCIRTTAAFALAKPGEAAFMGRPTDGDTCEGFLNRWAAAEDISREDESTFDSGDFPKVIFAVQVEEPEHCGACGADLIDG